jgi:hypothetical protein
MTGEQRAPCHEKRDRGGHGAKRKRCRSPEQPWANWMRPRLTVNGCLKADAATRVAPVLATAQPQVQRACTVHRRIVIF